jgi:predicted phosphodiesterase
MQSLNLFVILTALTLQAAAQDLLLPLKPGSVRFAVIGDSGSGKTEQYEVGQRMVEYRQKFPFEFVIMLGDNIYGKYTPRDFEKKFERPYKELLDQGVKFYAALGNHDNPNQRFYKLFNMDGRQYYTFTQGNVDFFVLDSNYMDKQQLDWVEKVLQGSGSGWKICYFHHPLYSSGARHGPDIDLRTLLEPLFLRYGVQVVFAGHEHFYERIKPQKGIYYFISGGAAKIRKGNIKKTDQTAAGYDQDRSFMLVEVAGDDLYFQTVSRTGDTVDSGVIRRTMNTNLREPSLPSSADRGIVQSAAF